MKTAGIVIDFYDDPTGRVLKDVFGTVEDLPPQVKTAHILNGEERDVLRNEAFALVVVNEGMVIRKFACVDPGNTLLSMHYLEKTSSCLPEEVSQLAAKNILSFCNDFGIKPSEFIVKEAGATGMHRDRDSFKQPVVGDEADWNARTNLVSLKSGTDSGRVLPMANQIKTASVLDVSNKTLKPAFEKKASSRYALGNKYPLDSYADVQKAVEYFDTNWTEMSPSDRHEYCVKTASRADELGIEASERVRLYGQTSYSENLEAHLVSRQSHCSPEWVGVYEELKEKAASVSPEEFVSILEYVDEETGLSRHWDGKITDPFLSTFGYNKEKIASELWSWKSDTGDMVSADQLKKLAKNGRPLVHKHFSSDVTNAFINDPTTIFDSLPDTSKKILCNLANGEFDTLSTN